MPLSAITRTLLEKVALDAGFDRPLEDEKEWLRFASSQAPLVLGLCAIGESSFVASFSMLNVASAVTEGTPFSNTLPTGSLGARAVGSLSALGQLVRRAAVLSRTLPDELLTQFEKATATLPRSTEVERWVVQRVGQDVFRRGLLDYWERRCAVTGLAVESLLRASHIKRWADCASDAERLDVHNGLLLAPHLDAAFDAALITFDDAGAIAIGPSLLAEAATLGVDASMRLNRIADGHRAYLREHRKRFSA